MQFSIRALTAGEQLSECASLMVETSPWNRLYFSKEQCENDLAHPMLSVHGAVADEGTILGFIASMAHGIGFEPMIEYLCVGERFRGTGIGTTLIEYFEDTLFPDADNLYLFVSDINPQAMKLYRRSGYVQVGELPDFNLENQTEFLYRKTRRPRQAAARLARA